MDTFKLDPRLANDCLVLGELHTSLLLMMNNALVPWFILVPRTSETEITDLPPADQALILEEINLMSGFVKDNFPVSKMNIAAIGNIVSQLHIHVVGREVTDFCWPNVVWGTKEKESYRKEKIAEIRTALIEQLGNHFSSYP